MPRRSTAVSEGTIPETQIPAMRCGAVGAGPVGGSGHRLPEHGEGPTGAPSPGGGGVVLHVVARRVDDPVGHPRAGHHLTVFGHRQRLDRSRPDVDTHGEGCHGRSLCMIGPGGGSVVRGSRQVPDTLAPMATDRTTVLDRSAFTAMMQGASDGFAEILGALAGSPILVVDLDSPGDRPLPAPPPELPAVIVGTSRRGGTERLPVEVDVALTDVTDPPHPWVAVPDLGPAVSAIAEAVERSPLASVTLAQVLRAGRSDSLGHDLILESLAYSTLQGGPEFGRWRAQRPPRRRSPDGGPAVVVGREGGRLTITLDRPEVRNAFNAAMRDQLCEALSMVGADPSITDVQLLGHGQDFCSGGDLTEFGTFTDPVSAHLGRTARERGRPAGRGRRPGDRPPPRRLHRRRHRAAGAGPPGPGPGRTPGCSSPRSPWDSSPGPGARRRCPGGSAGIAPRGWPSAVRPSTPPSPWSGDWSTRSWSSDRAPPGAPAGRNMWGPVRAG